ncbi:3642_t:CDS:2, partial [Acaulospora colombiana]
EGVQEMLKDQSLPLDLMMDDQRLSSNCKVALLAVRTASVDSFEWFRTYPSPHSEMESSVVDALCASMALATIFAPVMVGPEYAAEEFSGGGLGFNNPTRELLKEAQLVYGRERQLSVILSLGAGRPKELSLEGPGTDSGTLEELVRKLTISCETVERDVSYQLYDVGAYIRLNVDQGLDSIGFYQWSQLGKVTSHTKHYLQRTSVVKLVDASIIALAEEQGVMALGQLARTTKIKRQAKAPPAVSPYFVVRKGIWEIFESKIVNTEKSDLNNPNIFVITGMGGCGKTQMTAYFVQSSHSTIQSDLRNAIRSIDGHQQDTDEDALSFLSNHPDSLLIFDNADNPKLDLVAFFPRSYRGIILITSRVRSLGELATLHHLELGPMSNQEGIETLAKASRRKLPVSSRDEQYMKELVEEL